MRLWSFLTVLSLGFLHAPMIFAQDSDTVDTSTNGNLSFQIKMPEKGCKNISLELKDTAGKRKFSRMKLNRKQAKPDQFSDVLKFSLPAGQYQLNKINCNAKSHILGIHYKPGQLAKSFEVETVQGPTSFNVSPGRDTYLGALDFHRIGAQGHALITLDKSTKALGKGQLSPGKFDKSFLATSFNHIPVKDRYLALLAERGDVEGNVQKVNDAVDSGKPPSTGKGEIALHIKSDFDCNYLNVGFVPSGKKKGSLKVVSFGQNKEGQLEGFATAKVKSGRYRMSNITCGQENGKYLQSQSLIRAEVDVYPKDIAYLGELYFKKTVDNTARIEAKRKELIVRHPTMSESGIDTLLSASRIPPYQFAMVMQDRFEDAKTQVKKPERLKRRKLDSTNYRKKEVANNKLISLNVIKLRIKEVTKYEEALNSYDSNLIIRP